MPRGGKRPNAGRPRGSKGKATIEKAIMVERSMADSNASGRKLGKEVIEHYMHVFAEIADAERVAALADKPTPRPQYRANRQSRRSLLIHRCRPVRASTSTR
jgi:hypothetical protein